jgi:ankyrin repeat protein
LYAEFIKAKFDKFSDTQTHMRASDRLSYDKFLEQRQLLALYVVLEAATIHGINTEEEIETLLPGEMGKIKTLIDQMKKGEGCAGVVDRIVDGKPNFVHLTFSEYLAAQKLVDIFKLKIQRPPLPHSLEFIFETFYVEYGEEGIQRFIDRIVTKDLPLHTAILNSNSQSMGTLLSTNQEYRNHLDTLGRTPLHLAAMRADYAACDKLLKLDAATFINMKDKVLKWTPIRYLDQHESSPIKFKLVNLLLSKGATLDDMMSLKSIMAPVLANMESEGSVEEELDEIIEIDGESEPLEAIRQKDIANIMEGDNIDLFRSLLEKYPHLNQFITVAKETLLHLATRARNSSPQIVKYLVGEQKAEVNVAEKSDDSTPLHNAVEEGNSEIVQFLVDKGADVNAIDKEGWAPLHLAVQERNIEIIKILLTSKNIDPELKDHNGKTALDLASDEQRPEIDGLLNERKQNNLKRASSSSSDENTPNKIARKNLLRCFGSRPRRHAGLCELDSEYLLEGLGELHEAEQVEILEEVATRRFAGVKQKEIAQLVQNQRETTGLQKIGKFSSGVTEVIYYSQAGIDLIFNGDVNSTANLLFFKGVGFLSEKSAGWLDTKGASLLTENIRAGKLLRSLSPVVSRAGTSALIGLDFYNQIKALQKDNHNVGAWIGVGGDGIQLGTDGITVGIEVAEVLSPVMAELELSAVANPIAMTIAVPITLLTRGYVAYETVESEEHAEHLTIWEKTTEGARAFVGFRPESYIQKMTDEVSAYERLLTKNVDYLKCNPNIKHLIFPAIEKTSEIKTCNRTRPFQKGCTTFYTPVFTEVEYKFVDFRSKELSGFKLTREKISPPSGSQLLCVPTAEEGNELPTEGAYLCRGAIALSQTNNTAGTDAEFELGIKTNKMTGFGNLTNVFRIRGDTVFCKGGSRDDRFILNTKLYKVFDDQVDPLKLVGGLDGREGSDTLILQGDQLQTSKIIVNLPAGRLRYEYINLCIKNIENVIAAVPITVIAACDTQVIVTAAGAPTFSSPNNIVIPSNSSCSYALKTHLQGNSVLRNEAELGDFIYYIKPGVGRVSVELVLPRAKSTESPRSLSFGPEPIPLGRAYPSYPSIDMEYDELTVTNATSAEFYNRLKRDVLIPAVKPDEQKASSTVPDVRLQHRFVLMQDLSDISGISLQSPSGTEDAERLQVLNIHFRGHKIRKLIRSIETISIDKTNASSDINVHYQLKSGAVLKPHVLETITPIEKSNATSDANLNCSKPDVNHDIEHLRWLPSVLNQTQAQQVLKNYLGDQGADNFNISLSESRVIRGLVFNLLVNSVATDEFKLEVTYSLTNKPSFSFSNGGELKIVGQNNYFFNTTDNDNINRIMRIYSPIAFHHNIICNLKTPKNQRVIIGNKGREVMHNDPSASTTHLNGNGGESLFVMGSDATLSRLPLNATVLYHTGNHTDTLDFRPLTARIKAEFNATSKLQIITLNDRMNLGNDILLSLGIRHAPNNITEVITVRLNNALITDWYKKKLHIILHNAPQQIIGTSPLQQMDLPEDKPPTSWYANIFYFSQPKKFDGLRLKPIPLAFNKMHEIMIVSNDDVEEKTEIIIPRKYSQAKFFQHNKTNLIWTNTLSNSSRIVEPFSIVLKNFYQEQKLATLSFKFSNRKKIALKLKMQEISAAPNFEQALHEKKENLKKESLSIIATKQLQVQEDQNGTFTSNLPTSHYSSSGSMLETETDIYSDEEIEQSNFNETNFIRRRRFIESEEFISSSGAKQPSGIIQNAFNFINRLYSNKPVKNINDAIQEKANAYYDQYDRIKEARPKRCKNKAKKHLPAQFVQLGSDDTKQPVVTVSKTKQTLVRHITANPSLSQPRKPDFFAKATKPIFCQQQVQYDAPMQRNVSAKQGLSMKSNPVKAKQLISQMHLGEQIHHKPGKYTHTQYPSKARLSDGQPHPRSYKAYQQQHHHQTHRQQANSNPGITRVTASSDIQSTLFALSYISQNFIGKKNTPIYNPKIIRIQQQLERQTQRKISGQPLGMGIRN